MSGSERWEREGSEDEATAVAAPAARRRDSLATDAVGPLGDDATRKPTPSTGSTPTELDRTATSKKTRSSAAHATAHSTASTPLEAMHIDEWERTRMFCKQALVISGAAFLSGPLIGGDPTAKLIMYVGILCAAAALVWVIVSMRSPQDYTFKRIFTAAMIVGVAVQSGIYFFGVFSPAPALILLGIYFFAKGSFMQATSSLYILCASFQGVVSGLIIANVIPDRGLISANDLDQIEKIVVQVIIQLLYLVSFLVARGSRRSQLMALTKLEEAFRQVQVRDALLQEAQGDLNRALRIGDAGRHSNQIVGGFRLGVLIGRGGMGEVYDATHLETKQQAAVKLLHPAALASPDQLGRFLREIEAISMLESPSVVSLFKFGNLADGAPYLVMERLEGSDLSAYLRKRRRLKGPDVVELIRQVGRGLSAAWELGIVHRDIKPQNLFRTGDGRHVHWKILDFGVSKLASTSGTLTQGHVVGTPGYMAPEQARGEDVDSRADLYALAVIAYRTLTGRPAFSAKDVPATMYEVVYGSPHRPTAIAADLAPQLDDVLAIGMAKDPADRFSSPEALALALEQAIDGRLSEGVRDRAQALLQKHPWKGE